MDGATSALNVLSMMFLTLTFISFFPLASAWRVFSEVPQEKMSVRIRVVDEQKRGCLLRGMVVAVVVVVETEEKKVDKA